VKALTLEDLGKVDKQERMNIFRRFFAASRYNRLLIQQVLIRSALDRAMMMEVQKLERDHNNEFCETVEGIKKSGYYEEFLVAVNEEDEALQKIIEAYDKRMTRFG
jgi:hypothetical protein